jgi:hypothetical protein
MNPEERDRLKVLCEQIAAEQDHSKFVKLVQELDDFLEHKEKRLEQSQSSGNPTHPHRTHRLSDSERPG